MDAEDILMARERIAVADGRLAELKAKGIDTADLASQVSFARGALDQGRTLDVLAICEEVLLSARRLVRNESARPTVPTQDHAASAQPPTQATAREPKPEATSRYPSGVYATPGAEALDRHRLTEEIRQVVQADLMPKALTAAQLNERIERMVEKAFVARAGKLEADIEQRFQRLAADPETRPFAKDDAELPTELAAQLEARLESRAVGIAKQTAQAISAATASLETRLAEVADPERLRAAISAAIDHRIGEGLAQLELKHQESAARRAVSNSDSTQRTAETLAKLTTAVETLDHSLAGRIAEVVDERLPTAMTQTTAGLASRLEELADPLRIAHLVTQAVESTLTVHLAKRDLEQDESAADLQPVIDPALLNQLSQTVSSIEQLLPERIAAAIDARLPAALSQATNAIATAVQQQITSTLPPPVDVPVMIAGLGKELREDLAWQVERVAAERGWISLSDMQAELSRTGTSQTSNGGAGFARLEAALVEFVHQTQSQQQQFLAVLQQKVESGTAIVAQQLMRQRVGSDTFEVDGGAPARTTEPVQHAALEAISPANSPATNPANSPEPSLDVLSQSAQFRAISTLGDPTRPATANFLPGTQVTRRVVDAATEEPVPAAQPPTTTRSSPAFESATEATEPMAATEPTVMTRVVDAPDTTLDDLATSTMDAISELDTEVMELKPLSGIRPPITGQAKPDDGSGARPTAISSGATSALARTTAAPATHPATVRKPATAASHAAPVIETTATEASRASTRITVRSANAFPATTRNAATAPGTASGTSSIPDTTGTAAASHTGTVRMTGRVAALEASLRLLVQREVTAQMARTSSDKQLTASGLQPSDASTDRPSALSPHSPHNLRDEVLQALRDPAIRQQILGVVAVESLANPGALGELTGLRAFIRDEIRKAASAVLSASDAEKSPAETAS